jgi:hypothetical protein
MKLETASWWAQLHRADSVTSVWVETGSQCGGPLGGLKFGNTINGAQAEYLLVPHAPIPARRADYPEQIIRRHAVSFGADESHKPQV